MMNSLQYSNDYR